MNKTIKYITMATIGLTFMFGNTGELTNIPNKIYPNKKPIVSGGNTSAQVTDNTKRPKRIHKAKFNKKNSIIIRDSIQRPKKLRKRVKRS
tara:strand:- start:189 stop:458 length:270 start_codon:yes stop_codon:yes gene_type:complete